MNSEHRQQLWLNAVVPSSWLTRTEDNCVWVSGYSVFRLTKDDLASGPRVFDLEGIRAIILYGKVKYPNPINFETTDTPQIKATVPDPITGETGEGVHLLMILRLGINWQEVNLKIVEERISATVGLLAAFNGRNMVYEHLFDYIADLSDGKTLSTTLVTEHPLHFKPPDISASRLLTISESDHAIAMLPEAERNRIGLSLRWFESALYAGGTVDAYLKYWFAIETLGMPDTTNIRPLIESLARAYGLSYQEAQHRFFIGRLFGLRGRIVHNGQIIPISQKLSRYMESLYADILFEHLGLPTEHQAEGVLNDPTFELGRYLYEP